MLKIIWFLSPVIVIIDLYILQNEADTPVIKEVATLFGNI